MKVVIVGGGWAGCAAAITAKKAGADRFRYCDTVGIKEPFSLRKDI